MLPLAALLLLAVPQLPARELVANAPGLADLGEGPLDNDVFQPVASAAQDRLARGDELLARLRRRPPAGGAAERAWIEIFEHWHAALGEGAPGEAVVVRPWRAALDLDSPWPDPDGTAGGGSADLPARRSEGLEFAVLRRLLALDPAERALWTARFELVAAETLASAGGSAARLAALEARQPATRSAALAGVALAEGEFEVGRWSLARAWLERAERHARLVGAADVAAGIARRRALPQLAQPPVVPAGEGEVWTRARSLRFLAEIPLEDLTGRTHVFLPRPGEHAESGVAWFADGTALVQTYLQALVIDPSDGRRIAQVDPLALLEEAGFPVELAEPPRTPPGWPAEPAVANGRGVLVVNSVPPALLCFRLEEAQVFGGQRRPRLEWARVGTARIDGAGAVQVESPSDAPWPDGAPQPGPLVIDGRLFVTVQDADPSGAGRRGAWLVALDLASGRVVWSRLIARGVPLARSEQRFRSGAPPPSASQPLARSGARLLVGTHLGATALVEALDGRIAWSLATRRRPGEERGWTGARAPVFGPAGDFLLAPADSDRLYTLRGAPDLEGLGLFLEPPRRIGEALALLGGSRDRAVLFSRAGRERNLTEWQLSSGARWDAPWLAPDENFTGHAAVSAERVIFATQRAVYLHDRTRELYLAEYVPYSREFAGQGGSVHARGDRVLVLGPHLAWVLAAR